MDKSSKAENVYVYIRDQILKGRWKPGDRINDLKISEETMVSRISVREALFRLTETGIIEKEYWKGYFIKNVDKSLIKNIVEMRCLLEGQAIRNFMNSINDQILDEMENILVESEYYLEKKDFFNYMKIDFSFHEAIYKNQSNYIISNILDNYMVAIHMIRYISMGKDEEFIETARVSINDHRKILYSFKERNTEKALSILFAHLSYHERKGLEQI